MLLINNLHAIYSIFVAIGVVIGAIDHANADAAVGGDFQGSNADRGSFVYMANEPEFSIMNKLLSDTAPTNAAFATLPVGAVNQLLLPKNRGHLQKILRSHILRGTVEFEPSQPLFVKTYDGDDVKITYTIKNDISLLTFGLTSLGATGSWADDNLSIERIILSNDGYIYGVNDLSLVMWSQALLASGPGVSLGSGNPFTNSPTDSLPSSKSGKSSSSKMGKGGTASPTTDTLTSAKSSKMGNTASPTTDMLSSAKSSKMGNTASPTSDTLSSAKSSKMGKGGTASPTTDTLSSAKSSKMVNTASPTTDTLSSTKSGKGTKSPTASAKSGKAKSEGEPI